MEPLGIRQTELAKHLGMSLQWANEFCNGKRGVTPETANLLAQAFQTEPELWMTLQAAWDLETWDGPVRRIKPMI